eukprot:6330482-Pyramimonas_sp.AAC.1
MAQQIGDAFILGRRGRNIWHKETVLLAPAMGAIYGTTDSRRFHYQPMRDPHQPIQTRCPCELRGDQGRSAGAKRGAAEP